MSKSLPSRERILIAAAHEFADCGLAGARVDRIAAAANCNKQLIYRHFGDKEGLYRAVLMMILERKVFPDDLKNLPLGKVLAVHFRVLAREGMLRRLLVWEALEVDESRRVIAEEARATNLRGDCDLMKNVAGIEAEADAPMLLVASMALAMFPNAFPQMVKLLVGVFPDDPVFADRYSRFLSGFNAEMFHGPLAALKARSTSAEAAELKALSDRFLPVLPSLAGLAARESRPSAATAGKKKAVRTRAKRRAGPPPARGRKPAR